MRMSWSYCVFKWIYDKRKRKIIIAWDSSCACVLHQNMFVCLILWLLRVWKASELKYHAADVYIWVYIDPLWLQTPWEQLPDLIYLGYSLSWGSFRGTIPNCCSFLYVQTSKHFITVLNASVITELVVLGLCLIPCNIGYVWL